MEKKKKYQTHPLSHTPGGVIVMVEWKSGKVSRHPNIKYPNSYMSKILSENTDKQIKNIWVYDPVQDENPVQDKKPVYQKELGKSDNNDDLPF